jgi:hypothetical protein
MGEQYEAFKLAQGLDHNDTSYVESLLQQDAQVMYPRTFQSLIGDANQMRRNPYGEQLEQDQSGLPVVNITDSNGGYVAQVPTPGQTIDDQPPPPPQYYQPEQPQYPSPPPYYQQPQSEYPAPPQYYQPQPGGYESGQCEAQTAVGAGLGALLGAAIAGRSARGAGVIGGAVVGSVIANNGCP